MLLRAESDMAWNFSAAGRAVKGGQFAIGRIDRKGDEKIGVPVGEVGVGALFVEDDFGGARDTLKSFRKVRCRLDQLELAGRRIPSEKIDGGREFVDAVSPLTAGMKTQHPWAGAGSSLPCRRIVRRQLRRGGIELVDVNTVEAEIVDIDVTVVWRRSGVVGVRLILTLLVLARAGATRVVVKDGDCFAEMAV